MQRDYFDSFHDFVISWPGSIVSNDSTYRSSSFITTFVLLVLAFFPFSSLSMFFQTSKSKLNTENCLKHDQTSPVLTIEHRQTGDFYLNSGNAAQTFSIEFARVTTRSKVKTN